MSEAKENEELLFTDILLSCKDDIQKFDSHKFNKRASIEFQSLALLFLSDERTFEVNSKTTDLKMVLNSFIVNSSLGEEFFFESNYNRKKNEPVKNVLFALLDLFYHYNKTTTLKEYSIEEWFNRQNPDNIYYDEIGVGGSILHVNEEYLSKINKDELPKNENILRQQVSFMQSGNEFFKKKRPS